MSTMGSLKFCACTSEVTSAALREERGGGSVVCVRGVESGWLARGSRSDRGTLKKRPIGGRRVDRHAPLRLELVRRAHGRIKHGEVQLHGRGSGDRSPGALGELTSL